MDWGCSLGLVAILFGAGGYIVWGWWLYSFGLVTV